MWQERAHTMTYTSMMTLVCGWAVFRSVTVTRIPGSFVSLIPSLHPRPSPAVPARPRRPYPPTQPKCVHGSAREHTGNPTAYLPVLAVVRANPAGETDS